MIVFIFVLFFLVGESFATFNVSSSPAINIPFELPTARVNSGRLPTHETPSRKLD